MREFLESRRSLPHQLDPKKKGYFSLPHLFRRCLPPLLGFQPSEIMPKLRLQLLADYPRIYNQNFQYLDYFPLLYLHKRDIPYRLQNYRFRIRLLSLHPRQLCCTLPHTNSHCDECLPNCSPRSFRFSRVNLSLLFQGNSRNPNQHKTR